MYLPISFVSIIIRIYTVYSEEMFEIMSIYVNYCVFLCALVEKREGACFVKGFVYLGIDTAGFRVKCFNEMITSFNRLIHQSYVHNIHLTNGKK